MKINLISLTETDTGEFDLVLQVYESIEKFQISIFESDKVWGIQSIEFEKLLWKSGSAKENQTLIADIKKNYLALKKFPELQAA